MPFFILLIVISIICFGLYRAYFDINVPEQVPEKVNSASEINTFINQVSTQNLPLSENLIMVIDFETTGLPVRDVWPKIVSACVLIYNKERVLLYEYYSLIKQDTPIPADAIQIHGITTEMANRDGIFINEFIAKLKELSKSCKCLVAHNLEFDLNVILSELKNNGHKNIFSKHRKICTMKKGKTFCAIPSYSGRGTKYPSLKELVSECYNVRVGGMHNAVVDAKLAAACMFFLVELDYIKREIFD